MGQVQGRRPVSSERRREPRWLDKKLVTVRTPSGEYPGMTGDLSVTGMRIGLPCVPANVGDRVEVCVAFSQELLFAQCDLVYVRERAWGALVGVRYAQGQDLFQRFVARRYGQSEQKGRPTLRISHPYLHGLLNELTESTQPLEPRAPGRHEGKAKRSTGPRR